MFIHTSHENLGVDETRDKEDPDVHEQLNALKVQPLASPHNLNTPVSQATSDNIIVVDGS